MTAAPVASEWRRFPASLDAAHSKEVVTPLILRTPASLHPQALQQEQRTVVRPTFPPFTHEVPADVAQLL